MEQKEKLLEDVNTKIKKIEQSIEETKKHISSQ
jgi:hypothetical protein